MQLRLPATLVPLIASVLLSAQQRAPIVPTPHEWYFTSGGEQIFSWALLDVNGDDKGSIVRYSPFFNAQSIANYDLSAHAGFFAGLAVRNVGFIYDVPDTSLRFKFRTYTLGVPVGVKLGTMGRGLFFLGYELELPFNYKEKRFENEQKEDKFSVWFSDRTEPLFHTVMLGYQLPFGSCIKLKYYLTNFHNEDYEETKNGVTYKPYEGLKANIIYLSLGFGLFQKEDFGFNSVEPERKASLF